jgi:hypothetical protein
MRRAREATLKELTFGFAFAVLSIWIWLQARTFPSLGAYPGPALFPQVVAACLGLTSLIFVVRASIQLSRQKHASTASKEAINTVSIKPSQNNLVALLTMLAGLACVIIFPFLQDRLSDLNIAGVRAGGLVTLALLGFGVALLLRVRVGIALLVAIGTSVAVTVAFRVLLGVPIG